MKSIFDPEKPPSSRLDIVLRRRGHAILRTGELHRTLFWNAATNRALIAMGQFEHGRYFGSDPLGPYMRRFAEYSFRKMVTRIMRAEGTGLTIDEIAEATGKRTAEYLKLLDHLQVISVEDGVVRWVKPNDNLGPSLEHYVAALCERELGASAVEWNVVLDGVPEGGGELDVIASLDPNLIYIECKCALRNITDDHLREMLHRNEELTPELSILLIDTDSSLEGIVKRLNKILREYAGQVSLFSESESFPGVYRGNPQTYVVNNQPSILRQLRSCLRHFHAVVKPGGGYGFERTMFVKRPQAPGITEEPGTE